MASNDLKMRDSARDGDGFVITAKRRDALLAKLAFADTALSKSPICRVVLTNPRTVR